VHLVINTNAINCLKRLVFAMICYVYISRTLICSLSFVDCKLDSRLLTMHLCIYICQCVCDVLASVHLWTRASAVICKEMQRDSQDVGKYKMLL